MCVFLYVYINYLPYQSEQVCNQESLVPESSVKQELAAELAAKDSLIEDSRFLTMFVLINISNC